MPEGDCRYVMQQLRQQRQLIVLNEVRRKALLLKSDELRESRIETPVLGAIFGAIGGVLRKVVQHRPEKLIAVPIVSVNDAFGKMSDKPTLLRLFAQHVDRLVADKPPAGVAVAVFSPGVAQT